ncbi:MAG: hypothetical protein AB7E76_10780 [Deferribacterales bacterium]
MKVFIKNDKIIATHGNEQNVIYNEAVCIYCSEGTRAEFDKPFSEQGIQPLSNAEVRSIRYKLESDPLFEAARNEAIYDGTEPDYTKAIAKAAEIKADLPIDGEA